MFYSRQLSIYNQCIYVGDTNNSFMCMWHEGQAKRGSNEIASCLTIVLMAKITTKKRIEIWCDNCSGQNKNQMLVMAMIYLVLHGPYHEILMNFLVSGHSYMPCDADFGQIEKRKKVTKCMVPSEVKEMIEQARLSSPFRIMEMKKNDFRDFRFAAEKYLNTTKLQISRLSQIRVTKQSALTGILYTKDTFSELINWVPEKVFKKNVSADKIKAAPLLQQKIVIDKDKRKDLLAMIDYLQGHLSVVEVYHSFHFFFY